MKCNRYRQFQRLAVAGALFTFGLALFFASAETLRAQDRDVQTLFAGEVTHGGFGGPVVKVSDLRGSPGVWIGGRGGWIMNLDPDHALSLGAGGHALVTDHRAPAFMAGDNADEKLAMTVYGGFVLEYTNRSWQLIHLTVTSLIGGGALFLRDHHFEHVDETPDSYFVFEPGVNVELNVARFFRVAPGIGYRFTSGVSRGGFTDSDLSGLTGTVTFKFGRFR